MKTPTPKTTPITTTTLADGATVTATRTGRSLTPKTYTRKSSAERAARELAKKGLVTVRAHKAGAFFYVAVDLPEDRTKELRRMEKEGTLTVELRGRLLLATVDAGEVRPKSFGNRTMARRAADKAEATGRFTAKVVQSTHGPVFRVEVEEVPAERAEPEATAAPTEVDVLRSVRDGSENEAAVAGHPEWVEMIVRLHERGLVEMTEDGSDCRLTEAGAAYLSAREAEEMEAAFAASKPPVEEMEAAFAAARTALPAWSVGQHEPYSLFLNAPNKVAWWKLRIATRQNEVVVLLSHRTIEEVPVTTSDFPTVEAALAHFARFREDWTRETVVVCAEHGEQHVQPGADSCPVCGARSAPFAEAVPVVATWASSLPRPETVEQQVARLAFGDDEAVVPAEEMAAFYEENPELPRTGYQVIHLEDDGDHGVYDSLDEARGCVAYDRLSRYSIWRGTRTGDDFSPEVRVENCDPYEGDDARAAQGLGADVPEDAPALEEDVEREAFRAEDEAQQHPDEPSYEELLRRDPATLTPAEVDRVLGLDQDGPVEMIPGFVQEPEVAPAGYVYIARAIVKGEGVWGRGATEDEAVENLRKEARLRRAPRKVQVGLYPDNAVVNGRGDVEYTEPEATEPAPVAATEDELQVAARPALSTREEALLVVLYGAELAAAMTIERLSEREFDLRVENRPATAEGPSDSFAAWVPLAAIAVLDWSSPRIAGRTDYPDIAAAGDWSGVRDTARETLWAIFEGELPGLLGEGPSGPRRKGPRAAPRRSTSAAKTAPAKEPRGYQLLGHSAAAVIRRLGAEGKTIQDAEALLAAHGLNLGHKTVSNLISRGRRWARRPADQRPAKWAPAPISIEEILASVAA